MYTVLTRHGSVQGSGLSLEEAAKTVLTYDGNEFEVRKDSDGLGHTLWVSRFSRNSSCWDGLTRSRFYSGEIDLEPANKEIFAKVVKAAYDFDRQTVMTDDAYNAEQAELNAE